MTEYISWWPGPVILLYLSTVIVSNRSGELHVVISKTKSNDQNGLTKFTCISFFMNTVFNSEILSMTSPM